MSRRGLRRTALVGIAASSLFFAAGFDRSAAAVHALVVGINDYTGGPQKLRGAVNDANDIAAALRASGITDITLITDADATRERTFAAWEAMVKNSAEGDLLVFTFAGHGITLTDDNGDEDDGQDEVYLFVGFDEEQHPDERLIDDELDAWLKQAGDTGRKVLFVADACHSGSPTRSVFGESLPTRFYIPRTDPERPRPLAEPLASAPATRDYVFSVGATLDSHTVPEILIGDAPRGALSYAVARAFEGLADDNGDGVVEANEFEAFVGQNVRNIAASRQTPQFDIPDETFPIVRVINVVADEPTETIADSTLRIHIREGADGAFRDAVASIEGVRLSDREADAHLVFDPSSGTLASTARDVVADGLDLDGLRTAIAADKAIKALAEIAQHGTLPIALTPNDEVHPEGTQIGFTVPSVGSKYLTVFDLTATGSVHFLWPTGPEDSDPFPPGKPFTLDALVTPPFGADNLVVLATEAPPDTLRDALRKLDGGRDPAALIASLREALNGQPYRIALQAFFTREK